jgi:hypothetical protein
LLPKRIRVKLGLLATKKTNVTHSLSLLLPLFSLLDWIVTVFTFKKIFNFIIFL